MEIFDKDVEHLTCREVEVLHLVAKGRSAKEIALQLDIAACTVTRHIEHVRLKTRTRNKTHMIVHLITNGLLKIKYLKED